jgi:hypothetical protein
MTIERRLTTPARRDALRDKRIELNLLLYDSQNDLWRAYGIFPGGSGDNRLSSPVGNGRTPKESVDALIGMKVCVAKGLATATWALNDAIADLIDAIQPYD